MILLSEPSFCLWLLTWRSRTSFTEATTHKHHEGGLCSLFDNITGGHQQKYLFSGGRRRCNVLSIGKREIFYKHTTQILHYLPLL
ncbi:hypothetical protein J3E68DRAFT_411817 [Trichoderma sp. SZMC 28012]